jgi:hypothetical protein
MPVDSVPIVTRLREPGDLRHPVADRDQKHPTASAATQANTRDFAKWHVDYAAHSQLIFVQLTVSHHERWSLRISRGHCLLISRVLAQLISNNDDVHFGYVKTNREKHQKPAYHISAGFGQVLDRSIALNQIA